MITGASQQSIERLRMCAQRNGVSGVPFLRVGWLKRSCTNHRSQLVTGFKKTHSFLSVAQSKMVNKQATVVSASCLGKVPWLPLLYFCFLLKISKNFFLCGKVVNSCNWLCAGNRCAASQNWYLSAFWSGHAIKLVNISCVHRFPSFAVRVTKVSLHTCMHIH